jgi:hypothetical protein
MDEREGSNRREIAKALGWRGRVGLVGWALFLRRISDEDLQVENPRFVWPTRASRRLAALALDLATKDTPPSAVLEILRASAKRPDDLLRAAADIRYSFDGKSTRESHRANRLLLAAHGELPMDESPPQVARMFSDLDVVRDALEGGRFADGFSFLSDHAPDLVPLAERVASDRERVSKMSRSDQDDYLDDLFDEIIKMFGYRASESPFLRSDEAFVLARAHFLEVAGLVED